MVPKSLLSCLFFIIWSLNSFASERCNVVQEKITNHLSIQIDNVPESYESGKVLSISGKIKKNLVLNPNYWIKDSIIPSIQLFIPTQYPRVNVFKVKEDLTEFLFSNRSTFPFTAKLKTPWGVYATGEYRFALILTGTQGANLEHCIAKVDLKYRTTLLSNVPPIAKEALILTDADTAVDILLTATDINGDPLSYFILKPPRNGILTGEAPEMLYTPNEGFNGRDYFTFRAFDGSLYSNITMVKVDVGDVVRPPVVPGGVEGLESTQTGPSSVLVSWNKTEHASHYLVFYGVGESGFPYWGVGLNQGDSPIEVTTNKLQLTGLSSGTFIYVNVIAVNSIGKQGPLGSELMIKIEIDDDKVADYKDECLETVVGIEVEESGCATVVVNDVIEKKLGKCRNHFKANRLMSGRDGNAYACYREVLEIEADNKEALLGIEEIASRYIDWIEDALAQGKKGEARKYVFSLKQISPELDRIEEFEKALEEESFVLGKVFRDRLQDGSLGPKMVVIPAGSFKMGDIQGGGFSNESPVHEVMISKPFAIGKYEVTFAEYDKFCTSTGRKKPSDKGWGRGKRPVMNVNWNAAVAYTQWLSKQTGKKYQLPTEAQWEYAARAGSTTKYPWGNKIGKNRANCDRCEPRWVYRQTAPVGSFSANKFGLHDTVGNVREWVFDWYSSGYAAGHAIDPHGPSSGKKRVLRGGSWVYRPKGVRSAARIMRSPYSSTVHVGFRLSRTLNLDEDDRCINNSADELAEGVKIEERGCVVVGIDDVIEKKLGKCRNHFKANRLMSGKDGNAYACYREVLKIEADNEDALLGIEEIASRYIDWIELALARDQKGKARKYVLSLKQISPELDRIEEFEKALEEEPFVLGKVFRDRLQDGSLGPEMVVIPAGSFKMGDIQGGGFSNESPVHEVRISKPFAIGKYEVTFAEYDKFCTSTGRKKPSDKGWGRGERPVLNVNWNAAVAYTQWLSKQTGKKYQLPTEAQWEYAARAGSTTKYPWGNKIGKNRANCDGCGSRWDDIHTAPVGSFSANKFGLHDTVGNLWEWVFDWYSSGYVAGRTTDPHGPSSGKKRVLRGGCWMDDPKGVRLAARSMRSPYSGTVHIGFRLSRTLHLDEDHRCINNSADELAEGVKVEENGCVVVGIDDVIEKKLGRCRNHFKANRLMSGRDGNAYACYREVLKIEADNKDALLGIEEIASHYIDRIEGALAQGQKGKARMYMFSLKQIFPKSDSIEEFEKALEDKTFVAGKIFRDRLQDGTLGPEMVVIPAGTFTMGDIQEEGWNNEKPVHEVTISESFAMGKYEVTFAEYDKFCDATGRKKPSNFGRSRENRPVIRVSWDDAVAYTDWLSKQTGKKYQLPTEAQWEYAARAGSETKYWWGNKIGKNRANCRGCGSTWDNKQIAPVGSFSANQLGLFDTVGNVEEWVFDWYFKRYAAGHAIDPHGPLSGSARVFRGGSFYGSPKDVRSANRNRRHPARRLNGVGFRISRILHP